MLSEKVQDFVRERLFVDSAQDINGILLSDGLSGAEVYSIKVKSQKDELNGRHIVKICNEVDRRNENEADKAIKLHETVPEFANHLVSVEAKGKVEEKEIIIYSQANNSQMHSVAFSKLSGKYIAQYARCALRDLLVIMNKEIQIDGNAEEFYNCLLKKQLGESGRFVPRMEELLSRPEAECVAINGNIYPNPLYFMRHITDWSRHISDIHLYKGIVHGDLHGFNLLAADGTYSIIDFDSLEFDSFLLFDHAYFEFSIFYDNFKDYDLKRWNTILEQYITPSLFEEGSASEFYLEYMVRNAVCEGISDWMKEKKQENEKDDIELQFLMCRIAAGINFFCKKNCTDFGRKMKVLLYISHCFDLLLKKIKYPYHKNDISHLNLPVESTNIDCLWDDFLRFTNYVPVLVTDDAYAEKDIAKLKSLCNVQWALVLDVGQEKNAPVLYKSFLENFKSKLVKRINMIANETVDTFTHTLNILFLRNSEDHTYTQLWRHYGEKVLKNMGRLLSENPQVPLVFVFDCNRKSLLFRDNLVNRLCDLSLPGATRFVSLRTGFSDVLRLECEELKQDHFWHFIEHPGATLVEVAQSCNVYLNTAHRSEHTANLPSLDGIYTFSAEDLLNFSSSIELVYSGCEYMAKSEKSPVGFDTSGGGDSLGEEFYKGNEASWSDISNHRDLRLLEEKKYKNVQERLQKLLEENSPRIRKMRIIHGAGTGGTTLAKRILWDLREIAPCVRLKKHSPKTADMLLEIYRRTGKKILMTIEQGSTIITDDELNTLIQKVNSENGKLLLLLIIRSGETVSTDLKEEADDVLVRLRDVMPASVSVTFRDTFSAYAKQKTNSAERIKLLEAITGESRREQRSPFFYGFYTFQEEYNLFDSLKRTVLLCSNKEKILLNHLALVTAFSQNVCVTFTECLAILEMENDNGNMNIYVMQEMLSPALSKLMVMRNNGFRLCHKIIAEKILVLLHGKEEKHAEFKYAIYPAAENYIKTLCKIYGKDKDYIKDNDYVDKNLKELFIDRAYIDADEQKTKFSPLVEAIPFWVNKNNLFELLIKSFPENPHYYNHLARLLAFGDKNNNILPQYEESVRQGKKAISVAEECNSSSAVHRTTLGFIYGQWIIHDIREEIANKRAGRLSLNYSQLIDNISVHYNLAYDEFVNSRSNSEAHDSFSYFPQINMECNIIDYLIQFDQARNLAALIEQEPSFKEWYDEHFSIATELIQKMEEQSEGNDKLLVEAKSKLKHIALESPEQLKNKLTELLRSDAAIDKRHRRSLTYAAFAKNGASWNMDPDVLDVAQQCFRKNIMDLDGEHKNSDVQTWFELYRRTKYFDAAEAQAFIADYMEDGYKKEYLLFLLAFVLCEEGHAGASRAAVATHAKETQRLAHLRGLNTAREHDVFVNSRILGCPIVSIADVQRNENREPIGLKVFTGIVTEVEQTHGKILLNNLNLDVTFIPNPSAVSAEPKKIFTRQDISHPVELNLMFSYSGLRAWNVTKIK